MDFTYLKPIELSKIKLIDFPKEQYYQEETNKTQICLHHTVSGPSIQGDLNTWLGDVTKIGTHFIIDRDGTPYQLFSSKFWIHHIGMKSDVLSKLGFKDSNVRNNILNKQSIGIEIDNWGYLILGDGTNKKFGDKVVKTIKGKYYNAYGNTIDVSIQEYPNLFRGQRYYEKYTDAQIKTVGELLLYFHDKFGIPMDYNDDMWDVSMNALSSKSGVYSHCSYRNDKSDCHPQKELIDMLKSLKK